MNKFFDVHAHVYPEKISSKAVENLAGFYDIEVTGGGTLTDYLTQAKNSGYGGMLLLTVATNPAKVAHTNAFAADAMATARDAGFLCEALGGMHQDCPDMESEVERAAGLGLRGIKIHPDIQGVDIDDPRLLKLYEMMEGRMILCLHMGDDRPKYSHSSPDKLKKVADMFPKLQIIGAHFGGYRVYDEAVDILAGTPNVWYDTSSSLMHMDKSHAADLIHRLGVDKMMYGTDYPIPKLSDEADLFMRLPITDNERHMIMWDNALELIYGGNK